MIVSEDDKLLSRKEAAEYLGVSESTLAVSASAGRNELPYAKVGRLARYRRRDLDKWIDERRRTQTE